MATQTDRILVQIVVDSSKARKEMAAVSQDMKRTANAAENIRKAFTKLNSALAIVGGATFIGKQIKDIIHMADQYKELGGRVNLVARDTVGLQVAQDDLLSSANKTYTSYESLATIYSRVGLAMKDMNVSHKDLIRFGEAVANSLRLSGASAQEARASLLQLSQAMASGRLSGDEFRSISENNVALLDQLTIQLGVTRKELKQMADDQELTTDKVFGAMIKASAELEKEVANLPVTVGRAMTVVHNEWQRFIADLDGSTGATRRLSSGLLDIASALRGLTAGIRIVQDLEGALWGASEAAQGLLQSNWFFKAAEITGNLIQNGLNFQNIPRVVAWNLAGGRGTPDEYIEDQLKIGMSFGPNNRDYLRQQVQAEKAIEKATGEANKQREKELDLLRRTKSALDPYYAAKVKYAETVSDIIKSRSHIKTEAEFQSLLGKAKTDYEKSLADLADKGTSKGGGSRSRKSTDDQIKNIERLRNAVDDMRGSLDPMIGLQNEYTRNVQTLVEALNAGAISQEKFNDTMSMLKKNFSETAAEIKKAEEKVSEWQKMSQRLFEDFTKGFADAFVDSILEGRDAFRSFAYEFFRMMAKMIAQQMMFNALTGLGKAVPAIGKFLPLPTMDSGGSIPSGGAAIVGEKGAEIVTGPAYVTGRQDTAKLLKQLTEAVSGAKGSGSNIRIINAVDPAMMEEYLGSDSGEKVIMNVLSRNRNAIRAMA